MSPTSGMTMPHDSADPRRYLQPQTLARISSLELRAQLIIEGLLAGMHRSPLQGASIEFAQHRAYTPGDDIRRVDWKVFARTDKIYLKQHIQETNLELLCVVDSSESMGFSSIEQLSNAKDSPAQKYVWTKYDHATAVTAALAYLAIQQRDAVGVAAFDRGLTHYLRPSNSPGQWRTLTQELLGVSRQRKTDTGRILSQLAEKLTHRSLIVLLSDFFDDADSIAAGLQKLRYRQHEIIALQILDPAEIEFPFEDVTLFKGLEETGQLLVEPRTLRKAYLAELENFTEKLRRICLSMRIEFTRLRTDQSLDIALSVMLATRAARMK